jgi:3-deoxy-D-manno-octulosonate 8-phosphate phosphatase KdsC-like HAD superfamily phosphatase
MKRAGIAAVPADGSVANKHIPDAIITIAKGGRGAVAEVIELVLDTQGRLDSAIEFHTNNLDIFYK